MQFLVGIGIAQRFATDVLDEIDELGIIKHSLKKRVNDYIKESGKTMIAFYETSKVTKRFIDDVQRLSYDSVEKDINKLVLACTKYAKEVGFKNPDLIGKMETANIIWLISEQNIKFVFNEAQEKYKFDVRADRIFDYTRIEPCRARWIMIANEMFKNTNDFDFGESNKVSNCIENLAKKIYSLSLKEKSFRKAVKLNWNFFSDATKARIKDIDKKYGEYKNLTKETV